MGELEHKEKNVLGVMRDADCVRVLFLKEPATLLYTCACLIDSAEPEIPAFEKRLKRDPQLIDSARVCGNLLPEDAMRVLIRSVHQDTSLSMMWGYAADLGHGMYRELIFDPADEYVRIGCVTWEGGQFETFKFLIKSCYQP